MLSPEEDDDQLPVHRINIIDFDPASNTELIQQENNINNHNNIPSKKAVRVPRKNTTSTSTVVPINSEVELHRGMQQMITNGRSLNFADSNSLRIKEVLFYPYYLTYTPTPIGPQ